MHVLAPIGRVARTWSAPTKRAGEWSGKIVELVALMAHECRDPEVKKIYYGSPKLDSSSTYKNIFEISSCGALAWDREALDELLLYCVCICSGNGFALSDGISAGLLNCYRSLTNGRLIGWRTIAESPPRSLEDIERQLGNTHLGQSQHQFLQQLHELIRHQITQAPQDLCREVEAVVEPERFETEEQLIKPKTAKAGGGEVVEPPHEAFDRSPLSLAAKIAASNYANWSSKAGVDRRWDQIPLAELKKICSTLVDDLNADEFITRQHSVLALICLLFGLSETAALDLHIGTPPPTCDADQWFDPTTGSHVWNHHVYLVGDDGRSNKDLLNYIPVPQALAEAIQQFAGPHMDGKQIKHILFPNTTFDATAFGRYLAAISSPAHPVTAARLSQSFGNAFLQCTQSDLAAAFCSLRLSLVGLASLYYFSPSREWVHQKCTEVFHELGLGAPVQFIGNNFRMGARSLPLDLTHIHKAWNQIEEIFLRAYRDVLRWASRDDAVEAFNSLSVLAATVLVASIGGRTSRPDRMLVSHLYSNDSFYAFSDKEVKETGLSGCGNTQRAQLRC